jgi:hypothetical protein
MDAMTQTPVIEVGTLTSPAGHVWLLGKEEAKPRFRHALQTFCQPGSIAST